MLLVRKQEVEGEIEIEHKRQNAKFAAEAGLEINAATPTDKYGKHMTDEEIEKAQEVAALAVPAQAEVEKKV